MTEFLKNLELRCTQKKLQKKELMNSLKEVKKNNAAYNSIAILKLSSNLKFIWKIIKEISNRDFTSPRRRI